MSLREDSGTSASGGQTSVMASDSLFHRLVLAVSAVIIAVPGIRLLVGTTAYVDGKANLRLTPDLYSELRAMGSLFLAAGLVLAAGAVVARLRSAATTVGLVAFLPQGIARLVSYSIDGGQHDSYLRAGLVETVVGLAFGLFLLRSWASVGRTGRR